MESQAFFFRFGSGPGIRIRLASAIFTFGIEIELGMKGVVRDGTGVPYRRMVPGALADNKSWLFCPGFHAAAPALADDGDVAHDFFELSRGLEKVQRCFGGEKKFLMATNLDSMKYF